MFVLLIENDKPEHPGSLFRTLEEQGYQVYLADTPETAAEKTISLWPNLIVFNPMHSHFDLAGFQQALFETKLDIPHVIVGKKNNLQAEIGEDTILVTPNKPQQLTQSIQKATAKQKDRFLRLPNLVIDYQQHNILRDGKYYSLTPKEFRLLQLLVEYRNQVLSRKIIMQKVWDTDYMGDTRTLDVHIRWLREKIEENPSQPRRLITIRGVGYRLMVDVESE